MLLQQSQWLQQQIQESLKSLPSVPVHRGARFTREGGSENIGKSATCWVQPVGGCPCQRGLSVERWVCGEKGSLTTWLPASPQKSVLYVNRFLPLFQTGGRQKANAVSDPFLHHSSGHLSRHWRRFEDERAMRPSCLRWARGSLWLRNRHASSFHYFSNPRMKEKESRPQQPPTSIPGTRKESQPPTKLSKM